MAIVRRAGGAALLAIALACGAYAWWRAHPADAVELLREHRGALASVERTPAPELGERVERWTWTDDRGDLYTGLWRAGRPRGARRGELDAAFAATEAAGEGPDAGSPWTVVLLGGLRTGDRAALILPEELGVHVLAVDWPWNGPRKMGAIELVLSLPAIRQALLRSPSALALGVDAALAQPEVDASRVALVGASLGVPSTAAALELTSAPAACALLHGGADLEAWFAHALAPRLPFEWLAELTAGIARDLARPLEPTLHASAASHVRMLIVNARDDERVPAVSAAALRAAFPHADERWQEGRHMRPKKSAMLGELALEVEAWLDSLSVDDRELSADDRELPLDDRGPSPDDRGISPDDRELPPEDRELPLDDRAPPASDGVECDEPSPPDDDGERR